VFINSDAVELVLRQILRAAAEEPFELTAYCFMPDHLHMVVAGLAEHSDFTAFVRTAKQYSGYYYRRAHPAERLWQRNVHDRIIRDDVEMRDRIRYVVANPSAAGLVTNAADYPFLGSQRWSRNELIAWCANPGVDGFGDPPAKPEGGNPPAKAGGGGSSG
jgi:putative transposase